MSSKNPKNNDLFLQPEMIDRVAAELGLKEDESGIVSYAEKSNNKKDLLSEKNIALSCVLEFGSGVGDFNAAASETSLALDLDGNSLQRSIKNSISDEVDYFLKSGVGVASATSVLGEKNHSSVKNKTKSSVLVGDYSLQAVQEGGTFEAVGRLYFERPNNLMKNDEPYVVGADLPSEVVKKANNANCFIGKNMDSALPDCFEEGFFGGACNVDLHQFTHCNGDDDLPNLGGDIDSNHAKKCNSIDRLNVDEGRGGEILDMLDCSVKDCNSSETNVKSRLKNDNLSHEDFEYLEDELIDDLLSEIYSDDVGGNYDGRLNEDISGSQKLEKKAEAKNPDVKDLTIKAKSMDLSLESYLYGDGLVAGQGDFDCKKKNNNAEKSSKNIMSSDNDHDKKNNSLNSAKNLAQNNPKNNKSVTNNLQDIPKATAINALKDSHSHRTGHRTRMKERFMNLPLETMHDYELLEMVLYLSNARSDVKPTSKAMLKEYGSLKNIILSDPEKNKFPNLKKYGSAIPFVMRLLKESCIRILKTEAQENIILSDWFAVIDYLRIKFGKITFEQFVVVYLDVSYRVVAFEELGCGTIDESTVYIREVIKKALQYGSTSIVLSHNHFSGNFNPSKADIQITAAISEACRVVNIAVIDHIIITADGHFSFRENELL